MQGDPRPPQHRTLDSQPAPKVWTQLGSSEMDFVAASCGEEDSFLSIRFEQQALCSFHCESKSQKCVSGKLAIFMLPVFATVTSFQFPLVFSQNLSENTSLFQLCWRDGGKGSLLRLSSTVERVAVALGGLAWCHRRSQPERDPDGRENSREWSWGLFVHHLLCEI